MKNNRRLKMDETLETVRERERERELYSRELSFIKHVKNINKLNRNIHIKDGLYVIEDGI